MGGFDPQDSHRNHPEGAVAGGALVVAGRQAAVLFAAIDQPLDLVAPPIEGAVEGASAVLRAQAGNGVADTPLPAVGPVPPAGIALVAHHPSGTQAGPSPASTAHCPLLQ